MKNYKKVRMIPLSNLDKRFPKISFYYDTYDAETNKVIENNRYSYIDCEDETIKGDIDAIKQYIEDYLNNQ